MSDFLNFVRGAQSEMHQRHMNLQVFKNFFRKILIAFLVSFIAFWAYNTPKYDYYLLMDYALSDLHIEGVCPKKIKHRQIDGRYISLTPEYILWHPAFKLAVERATNRFWQGLWLGVGVSVGYVVIKISFWVRRGRKQQQKTLLRGARLVSPKVFKQMVKKGKQASSWKLAGVPLPLEADTQHFLLCGSPGGGKTVCTQELLEQVRHKKQRAIVFDIKGSFVPYYYRPGKDIILNPLDERSPSWNLWQECESLVDYEAMAEAIVPNSTGIDSFWLKAAKTLLSVSAAQFKDKSKGSTPLMQDFLKHLFCNDLKTIEDLLVGTLGQALVGKDLEKGTRSVILTLATYCKSLLYVKDELGASPFLIREWVKNTDDDSWLFINASQAMAATLKPLISLWLELAVNKLLSLNEDRDRRLWLFFDELASLEKLNSLAPVLSRGRGYGACFVGGIQDIHQLRDIYGDKGAEILISSFGTSLFFYQNNNRSAEWAAEQLGSAEFLENREGVSFGAHEMRDGVNLNAFTKEQRLVLGSEIKNLKKREAFMTTSGGWPVTKLSFNYQEREEKEPALIQRKLDDISHQLIKNMDGSFEKLSRSSETQKLVTEEIKRTEEEAIELF